MISFCESQCCDRKSIRKVVGTTGDFAELAQDCVCFANGAGGTLLIGIEDNADAPPSIQRVDPARLDRIRKRVGELTVNVQVMPELKRHENGGEYIALTIPRTVGVASTSDGRWVPTICEGTDSVHVTVPRRVVQPGVIKLLVEADKRYQLTQRERITFALIAQSESVSAAELTEELELPDSAALRPWLGRLLAWGLVEQSGRTKATRYFVPPALLREAGLDALTTLTRVQPHRLRALILEDLERFPDSGRADIHRRIGPEIHEKAVARALDALLTEGAIVSVGERRWRKYRLAADKGHHP